jgi:hypothetical protein
VFPLRYRRRNRKINLDETWTDRQDVRASEW